MGSCSTRPSIAYRDRSLIRPFHLRDTLFVARFQQMGIPLDVEEQLTHPRAPLRSVLIDSIFSPRSGPSTFILDHQDEQESHFGRAQFAGRTQVMSDPK